MSGIPLLPPSFYSILERCSGDILNILAAEIVEKKMDKANLVMGLAAAFDQADTQAMTEFLHEEFTTEEFFPESMRRPHFLRYVQALKRAFPDMRLNMKVIRIGDTSVRGLFSWCGTQTGDLDLPFIGIPRVPATGMAVALPREPVDFIFAGEKIVKMRFETASGGDFRAILRQLGAELEGDESGT